jgi:hypothetical protein
MILANMIPLDPWQPKDVVSTILSLIALCISMMTFALGYRLTRRSAILGRKPVLVFVYDGKIGWILRNVGAGPALNVIVAQRHRSYGWTNPVRVPPLAKDGEMVLQWLRHVNTTGLGASYCDFDQALYTSICGNDLNQVFDGNHMRAWPEKDIHRHWDNPPYVE